MYFSDYINPSISHVTPELYKDHENYFNTLEKNLVLTDQEIALQKSDYVKGTIPTFKFGNNLNNLIHLFFVPLQDKTGKITEKVWNEVGDKLITVLGNVALELPLGTWEALQTVGMIIAFVINAYNLHRFKNQTEQVIRQNIELEEQIDP